MRAWYSPTCRGDATGRPGRNRRRRRRLPATCYEQRRRRLCPRELASTARSPARHMMSRAAALACQVPNDARVWPRRVRHAAVPATRARARSVQRRRKKRPIRPGKARGRGSQHRRAEPDVPELQTRGDLSPLSCSGRRQHRLVLLQSSVASWVRARARPGCGGPSYALGSLIARDQGGEGHELRRQKPSSINPSRLLSRRGGIAHAYIKCLLVWVPDS